MAKKRKQATDSTTAPKIQDEPSTAGRAGTAKAPAQEVSGPAQRNLRWRPLFESNEEEEDLDEDDLDEDDDDEEDDDEPPLPTFQVPTTTTDATLLTFLAAISTGDLAAGHALADWLTEQDDPRAALVRELAEARCVIPEGRSPLLRAAPMACGRWWCIVLRPWCVRAISYWNTPLYAMLESVRRGRNIEVRVPRDRQTPERLGAAFERCRIDLILGLFATTTQNLRAVQVVLNDPSMERVVRAIARYTEAVLPWLFMLRRDHPARCEAVLDRIRVSSDLQKISDELLSVLDPGWRQRLPAMMAGGTGAGGSPE
jgi:hypothetical protein